MLYKIFVIARLQLDLMAEWTVFTVEVYSWADNNARSELMVRLEGVEEMGELSSTDKGLLNSTTGRRW